MPITKQENAQNMVRWTAQKTRAQFGCVLCDDFVSVVFRDGVDPKKIAARLYELAQKIEQEGAGKKG
jgi:hypothetical protein